MRNRLAAPRWLVGESPAKTLRRGFLLAALTLLLFGVILRPVVVRGRSMEPTLRDGTWWVATRWWMDAQRKPDRFDLVVIRRAGGRVFYLKRVLALPGETVSFYAGRLRINDRPVEEPHATTGSDWTMDPVSLGPDEFFVAGDNRAMPMMDHAAGRVARRTLAGALWP